MMVDRKPLEVLWFVFRLLVGLPTHFSFKFLVLVLKGTESSPLVIQSTGLSMNGVKAFENF